MQDERIRAVAVATMDAGSILREIVDDVDGECALGHTEIIAGVKRAYRILAAEWNPALALAQLPKADFSDL